MQGHVAAVLRGAAQLEHPRPHASYGAQLGDRHELLVAGREPELDQPGGLVDRDPGGVEGAQVVRAERQHVAELLHVGGTEVVHGGPVDDQCPAAEPLRELAPPRDQHVGLSDCRDHASHPRTHRIHPEVRPGRQRLPLGERRRTPAPHRAGPTERPARPGRCRGARPSARWAGRTTSMPDAPTCTQSEVAPFSRSVSAAAFEACASGSASSARTSQPSPRAGGRTGSGRSATSAGVPSGVMSMPSSVERVSLAHTASSGSSAAMRRALRSTAAAAFSHSLTSCSCPSARSRCAIGAHARRIRTAEVSRPATVKYPT